MEHEREREREADARIWAELRAQERAIDELGKAVILVLEIISGKRHMTPVVDRARLDVGAPG